MFYLTLPSNGSLDYYPDNSPGHYVIRFPQEIDLTRGPWEIGLAEIQFSTTYSNIDKDSIWMKYEVPRIEDQGTPLDVKPSEKQSVAVSFAEQEKEHTINLGEGLIYSNRDFVKEIEFKITHFSHAKTFFRQHGRYPVEFQYHTGTKKTKIHVYEHGSKLTLSPVLADILGVTSKQPLVGRKRYISQHMTDVNYSLRSIFVYCDLIRPRVVGDTVAHLLRVLTSKKSEDEVYHRYSKNLIIFLYRAIHLAKQKSF